jgi:hypothetical protein
MTNHQPMPFSIHNAHQFALAAIAYGGGIPATLDDFRLLRYHDRQLGHQSVEDCRLLFIAKLSILV